MDRIRPGVSVGFDWWRPYIAPDHYMAANRRHEAAHAVISEALRQPVLEVRAGFQEATNTMGFVHAAPDVVPPQAQAVISLVGAPTEVRHLRQLGYDEEPNLLENIDAMAGSNDRGNVWHRIVRGEAIDVRRATATAHSLALTHSGLDQAISNVAQALQDRGDRLTGADVRAAMRGFELGPDDLWVPHPEEHRGIRSENAHMLREAGYEPAFDPGGGPPAEPDLAPDEDFEL
ncbi:hypothetical protein [Streptomyces sp. G-5]|uniref:hypothetical protein n=1 Tax=Streptomyces sp. G-5 TaxID=2977231 RepID=UPI0021D3C22D|nr:hypothetical protein [Streptomyces sp. G-5]MCU4750294.1 hypothetical protein [Streptomyces sp. G-5]